MRLGAMEGCGRKRDFLVKSIRELPGGRGRTYDLGRSREISDSGNKKVSLL